MLRGACFIRIPIVYCRYPKSQCAALSDSFRRTSDGQAEVGRTVLGMLRALGCRGPDSAGVALCTVRPTTAAWSYGSSWVRAAPGIEGPPDCGSRSKSLGGASQFSSTAAYARFLVDGDTDLSRLADAIESLDKDFEVVSIGHQLEIVKQIGSPDNLEKTFCVSRVAGHARPRAHAAFHRIAGGSEPLAAVLGPRLSGSGHRPQRTHHQLPSASPAL